MQKYVTKAEVESALTEVITGFLNDAGKIADKDLHAKIIEKMKDSTTFRKYIDIEQVVLSRIDSSRSEWLKDYISNRINGSK